MRRPSRREFLKSSVTAGCAAGLGGDCFHNLASTRRDPPRTASSTTTPSPDPLRIKKGVLLDMLPDNLSYADRFKLARAVGFEVVQAPTEPDERKAEEIKKAADGASMRIDSVMNMDHWKIRCPPV